MGITGLLTVGLLQFFSCALAAFDFSVNRHHTEVRIQPGGVLEISEMLALYFHRKREHLVRFIPLSGKNLLHSFRTARISIDGVRVEGLSVRMAVSNDALLIRMGEPGETVSGTHEYRLHYRVRGAVFTNDDAARTIFWNMAGAGWPVPLRGVSWRLVFPAGYFGAAPAVQAWSDPCGIAKIPVSTEGGISTAAAQYEGSLNPGCFLAVAVNLPDSAIPGSPAERAVFRRMLVRPLPVYLAALFVLLCWWAYYLRLRNTEGEEPLPPQGLSPMEAGYLADGRLNYRDIAAQVFEWARRGWVTIALEEVDGRPAVRIVKRRIPDAGVDRYERELFQGVFPGKLGEQYSESLTVHKLYKTTKKTAERMMAGLAAQGLMDREPRKFPKRFRELSWILFAALSFYSVFLGDILFIVPATAFFLAVYLPAAGMPERGWTPEGKRVRRRLDGIPPVSFTGCRVPT